MPFARSVSVGNSKAKLVLICLECAANGVTAAESVEDIRQITGLNQGLFGKAFRLLIKRDLIRVAPANPEEIIISIGAVSLRIRRAKHDRDSAWSILRAKVFATKGCLCTYCGDDAGQVDHVIPRSRGGSDDLENLVPCCGACNLAKGDRTPEEWLR